MAQITGYTAAKMNEFNEASIVSGSVNSAGSLILMTRGGLEIDAGRVKGDKGDTGSITVEQLQPYIPKWKPGTEYAVGAQVITPFNTVMSANVAHAANLSFELDFPKWNGTSTDIPYGHMGRSQGFFQLGMITPIVMQAAQVLKGGMTFDAASHALVMPKTGRYLVNLRGYFSGAATALNHAGILINGVDVEGPSKKMMVSSNKVDSADISLKSTGILTFDKGTKVSMFQSSTVSAWGTTGYNGSNIEIMYVGG